jgi:hypothetical protein
MFLGSVTPPGSPKPPASSAGVTPRSSSISFFGLLVQRSAGEARTVPLLFFTPEAADNSEGISAEIL